ncbi:hypothetical protein BGW39_003691 [Mortierella sp. 14UC]|nr:hypothetical protein BGW39_003691 [Mortierella sp. 14UC]
MDCSALCIAPEMNRRAIPTLIENPGATLQSVRLLERSSCHPREVATITSTDTTSTSAATAASTYTHVAQFLARCPQLTTLEVPPNWASFSSGISLRDLVETGWASRQLETLILGISESEFECESESSFGVGMLPEKKTGRSGCGGTLNRSDRHESQDGHEQHEQLHQHQQQQRHIALLVLKLSRKLKA